MYAPAPDPPSAAPAVPAVYTKADWASVPTAAQVAAVYPARDRDQGIGGSAQMRCQVTAGGAVRDCAIIGESPRGEGFGQAALALAPFYGMIAKQQGGAAITGEVTIPVTFSPTAAAGGSAPSSGSGPASISADPTPRP